MTIIPIFTMIAAAGLCRREVILAIWNEWPLIKKSFLVENNITREL